MAPEDAAPPPNQEDPEAAAGRPFGVATSYGEAALRLLDNGYAPLPIKPGTKRPTMTAWTTVAVDEISVAGWARKYPDHGIGLRTGSLVGIDIDVLDPDLAYGICSLVERRFGATLMRVGRWPKRLLAYRTDAPFTKMSVPGVEILAAGQQFVAFGTHPDTGRRYDWPFGDTPIDVALADLPLVGVAGCEELLAEIADLLPDRGTGHQRSARSQQAGWTPRPERDERGLVVDGRDAWLSIIAFHVLHDALDRGEAVERGMLAERVWERFAESTDLERPRKDGAAAYGLTDACRKLADKLRLLAEGRLPPRGPEVVEASYAAPSLSSAEARAELDIVLEDACRQIEAWHLGGGVGLVPRIGLRATVGLGKSKLARRRLLALRDRLAAAGAPTQIVIFTPSLKLAEEAAEGWRKSGLRVAVLRGYEALDPASPGPMCRDLEAVHAALATRLDIQRSVCGSGDRHCAFFEACAKQRNRTEVRAADIVLAAYDALYTGFADKYRDIAALLVDEGCWARAVEETGGIWVESLATDLMTGFLGRRADERDAAASADLLDLRRIAAGLLVRTGTGSLRSADCVAAGLSAQDCLEAARLEERRLRNPGLRPGLPADERKARFAQARANERTWRFVAFWHALAELIGSGQEGRIRIRRDEASGLHEIVVTALKRIRRGLADKPVLHLDATLRPELASRLLPGLTVTEIEAAAPHMAVRLITGPFGKSSLCQDPRAAADENRRRANRLGECADYVRWHARRLAPGRALVITHKDCEDAFADIAGVEVAHFNAVAGLDRWRDIALLVVIGRPLPRDSALDAPCAAFFGRRPVGGYRKEVRGVRMRDGSSRGVRVVTHEDEMAEVLRAAVCDDEMIQAIGRGRGINRSAHDPLEVHVLANVALPLVHDRVLSWATEVPDLLQRMLLAGIAVDSPADAAALHPGLFSSVEQARKAFQRSGLMGHFPISISYRGLSHKNAAYRRPGSGRARQRAFWIDRTADEAEAMLIRALGPLAEWSPGG